MVITSMCQISINGCCIERIPGNAPRRFIYLTNNTSTSPQVMARCRQAASIPAQMLTKIYDVAWCHQGTMGWFISAWRHISWQKCHNCIPSSSSEKLLFRRNFLHCLHRKLSKWNRNIILVTLRITYIHDWGIRENEKRCHQWLIKNWKDERISVVTIYRKDINTLILCNMKHGS